MRRSEGSSIAGLGDEKKALKAALRVCDGNWLEGLGRATLYLSLPFDIIACAVVGYYAARELGFVAELGAAIGAIIGTVLMWAAVYREVRKAARKDAESPRL